MDTHIGRFYARDDKVAKTRLTSETLNTSGIKTGRIKVDKLTDKNSIFLKKDYVLLSEDTGHEQTRHEINTNTRIYEQINAAELQLLKFMSRGRLEGQMQIFFATEISLGISIFWRWTRN